MECCTSLLSTAILIIAAALAYAVSNIPAKTLKKKPRSIRELVVLVTALITFVVIFWGLVEFFYGWSTSPVPNTFKESDLVGTWRAKYHDSDVDTITLKADGTYRQVFRARNNDYYESPWNKWYVEYTPNGKPKLHMKGMRYYVNISSLGEDTGRDILMDFGNLFIMTQKKMEKIARNFPNNFNDKI